MKKWTEEEIYKILSTIDTEAILSTIGFNSIKEYEDTTDSKYNLLEIIDDYFEDLVYAVENYLWGYNHDR